MNESIPLALVTVGVVAGILGFARVRAATGVERRMQALGTWLFVAAVALMCAFAGVIALASSAPRMPIGDGVDLAAVRDWARASAEHARGLLAALAGILLQLALFVGMVVPPVRDLAAFVCEHAADLRGRDQAVLARR